MRNCQDPAGRMKRGPAPIVGSEKLRPGLDALIPELQGREKDFPVRRLSDYRREVPGDFKARIVEVKE